jgi:predicted permease
MLADIRYALRTLRQTPLVTTMAVASMALAIGAVTAVFTLLDQMLLRTMPVKDPREIVQVTMSGDFYGGTIGDGTGLSYPLYRDLRDHNQVFEGMFSRFGVDMHLGIGDRSERVSGEMVSGSYFPVLGVGAALGRILTADDDERPGGHPVVVLSHAYWRSRFASDPGVVGRSVIANGRPLTIVGVASRGFSGTNIGQPAQVFVPMAMHEQFAPAWLDQDNRRFRWVLAFGRLRAGLTREQAAAGLQPLFRSLLQEEALDKSFANASPDAKRRFLQSRVELVPAAHGHSRLREYVTRPLWILMAIAMGVLLIACANVANLLIARGTTRQREIAVRLALGASRGRVTQQLLVEGLVLAAMGGALGLVLAGWGAGFLIAAYSTADYPLPISAAADWRIVAFTFAVIATTALLSALAPAFQSTRPVLAPTLKEGATSVLGGGPSGLRKALVVVQVALSLVLLVGAGLFVRSLYQLLSVDPGYNVARVVSFNVDLERNGYQELRSKQFAKDLLQRLRETPGVQSATFAAFTLLEGGGWGMGVTVEGYQPKPGDRRGSWLNAVSPGFFRTMELPLVAGREFTVRDEITTRNLSGENGGTWAWPFRVAVVNETFVKRYLGGRNPLGVRIGLGEDPGTPTPIEIVGVAADSKYAGIREEAADAPQVFLPALEHDGVSELTAYVRTARDPQETIAAIRSVVHQLDPTLPIFRVRTLEEQVARSLTNERLFASLSTVFAVLATLLAAVGLYGVMAFAVTRRTREIGIRIALGALGTHIAGRILREAGVLVVIGLGAGLGVAWWLTRFIESQLYGVVPHDPWTLATCALMLAAIAALAAWIPARRAARTDPIVALRSE